ncbi:MAG: diguanylate cyclase [Methylococcaceae bacterium]
MNTIVLLWLTLLLSSFSLRTELFDLQSSGGDGLFQSQQIDHAVAAENRHYRKLETYTDIAAYFFKKAESGFIKSSYYDIAFYCYTLLKMEKDIERRLALEYMNPWRWGDIEEVIDQADMEETHIINGFKYVEKLYADNLHLSQYVKITTIIAILTSLLAIFLFETYRSIKRENRLRIEAEAEVKKLVYHDVLTGLDNRHHFFILANQTIKLAARENTRIALLFIDINHLKVINGRFGRKVGDQVLAHAGYTLHKCVRNSDITGRLGGDEFAVLFSGIHNIEDVLNTQNKIEEEISRFIVFEDKDLHVSASIGMAIYPDDGVDIDTLLAVADSRMYRPKFDSKKSDSSVN